MDGVFDKWKEKLLDAGRGNRLINYKETHKSLEILAPDYLELFEKITNGDKLSFYDVDAFLRNIDPSELGENFDKNGNVFDKVTKKQITELLVDKLKKNQILSYKKGVGIQKTLKGIRKAYTDSLLEKGINILYMAFGFLKWKDDADESYLQSPLILIPVTIESNESKNATFTLSEYDDEINTNPTLNYLMKHEYGINIPDFQDEMHLEETLADYLSRVQEAVSDRAWEVNASMAIGTFSFLKMNMYKDLEENEQVILENNNVNKLLNRKVDESDQNNIDMDKYFQESRELDLHNVVDADSSQMQAIVKALSGKSFVLQGPPGTGKSQTITNLVAEFLYNNKKVLFVSEKLEALNVVYNNLRKVGLEDFCLELHSHKTNKKEVINELYRVLNKNKTSVTSNAEDEIQELISSKDQLDTYNSALHTIEPVIERTPYQLIGAVAKYGRDVTDFEYAIPDIENKGITYLKQAESVLDNYVTYSNSIGSDYHTNSWYGYSGDDLNYSEKIQLKKDLSKAIDYLNKLNSLVKNINTILHRDDVTLSQIYKSLELYRLIVSLTLFDKNLFRIDKLNKIQKAITVYTDKCKELNDNKSKIYDTLSNDIFEINLNSYYLKYRSDYVSTFRFMNKNYRRDSKLLKTYLKDSNTKLSYMQWVDTLKFAKNIQASEKDIVKLEESIFAELSNHDRSDIKWSKVASDISSLSTLLTEDMPVLSSVSQDKYEELCILIREYLRGVDSLCEGKEIMDSLSRVFDTSIVDMYGMDITNLAQMINNCINDFDGLDNWTKFNGVLNNARELSMLEFIDGAIEHQVAPKDIASTYKLMFYTQWLYYILSKNDTLHNFTRVMQDSNVQKFRKKDKLKFEIAKAEIVSKLSSQRPSVNNLASGSQVSTLVREAGKKRKQKPVRLLLEEINELVQTLKPCFLMSPLSVSTYLNSNSCKFDVVIFDEASQIFPWDAIGAIYRAEQVIVVGDSRQMPPSNYFNAEIIDEGDDENYDDDSLDFESILDLCAASFNQERLNWHYRSKTEDLIVFSNKNFYDGSLITFPSAYKDNADMGVDFYCVENGIFDRKTNANIIEANKVVDLVFEHFDKHPERSLGVVAFSISQQAAIEALIQERRESDDKYAEFFDTNRSERFFVKNLETVQGDERDTIIFSVAYAKDQTGKFIHNFGPLNRKGGERRLNVAITRAKSNVKLVSSIKNFDIDLNKTKSVGAKLLKEYLEYAELGMENLQVGKVDNVLSLSNEDFEDAVYKVITDAGYIATRNVGCSDYKIDIGVKHPTKPDYVLAVECDGRNYHLGRTTRDRDRLRQEVLSRLGWKFHRVWSTEWFSNNKIEKKKLLDAIDKAITDFDNNSSASTSNLTDTQEKPVFACEQEIVKKNLKAEFARYRKYDIFEQYYATGQPVNFDSVIYDLINTEGPIVEDLLLKETACFFGNEKVTSKVRNEFRYGISRHSDIYKIDNYYTVDPDQRIELRIPNIDDEPRDILLIPIVELASGVRKVIELSVGINKDGLFKTITQLLGYARVTDNIKYRLESALDMELSSGHIREDNGEYFVK